MRVCIPVKAASVADLKQRLKKARAVRPDFIEIWLDRLEANADIKELMAASPQPVIFVCKAAAEKGSFKGSEKARVQRLIEGLAAGAAFIDIGLHTNKNLIAQIRAATQRQRKKLIISKHFWKSTPRLEVLLKTAAASYKLGADIAKIATYIKNWSDTIVLFELTRRLTAEGKKVIVVGMGEKSKIARIGCAVLGGYLTYVALDEDSQTAPGQLTMDELGELGINGLLLYK